MFFFYFNATCCLLLIWILLLVWIGDLSNKNAQSQDLISISIINSNKTDSLLKNERAIDNRFQTVGLLRAVTSFRDRVVQSNLS